MSSNLEKCIELLKENDVNIFKEAQNVLIKLCNNILKNPQEKKYRKIRLTNAIISDKLLPASGAIESLFEIGFIEDDDGFLLPLNASLDGLKKFITLIDGTRKKNIPLGLKNHQVPSTSSTPNVTPTPTAFEEIYKKSGFFQESLNHFKLVLRYEDKNLQSKAKSLLPLQKLELNAMEKMRDIQREMKINGTQNDVVFEDLLLAELLNWFKSDFFSWVNSPNCNDCNIECTYERSIKVPDPFISRTEIHKCSICGSEIQFPRYTDPEPLLITRKGRCGEWANVFTLICRAVGFDARLVHDLTDHVWTEIWSDAHNRWIHADSCENKMDQPLLYEKGWGKKLTYVIAYSRDEIQDVTWRYTDNMKAVLKRRKLCSETALIAFINDTNKNRQKEKGYSEYRKRFVLKRKALELADMLVAGPNSKKANESKEEYGGRISGSLSWRLERGETNIKPSQWRIPKGVTKYELKYSIVNDVYETKDAEKNKPLSTVNKWQNGVELIQGKIFRKEELDWKMVYLARTPDSEISKIKWVFSIEDTKNMCIHLINIKANIALYNNAKIDWELEGEFDNETNKSKIINIPNCENFKSKDLFGAKKISVVATLYGSSGENAWQHAQLFRQSIKEKLNDTSMTISIELAKIK